MKFPKKFFRRVFRGTLQSFDVDIELRCLYHGEDADYAPVKMFWFRNLAEFERKWSEITDLNSEGYNIHYTVVPRLSVWRGKKEHPLPPKPVVSVIWSDLDVGKTKPHRTLRAAVKQLRALQPAPNMIVESGSGAHPYYMLRKPRKITKERLEHLLRVLAKLHRADAAASRATRLMRVPNTYNWKTGSRKLARVRYFSRRGYSLKKLEALWNRPTLDLERKSKQPGQIGMGKHATFFSEHLKKFVLPEGSSEARALCPFHDDHKPSLSINVSTGRWKCFAEACGARGDLREFCKRLAISPPASEIKRFPRERTIPEGEEWSSRRIFDAMYSHITSHIYFTQSWQPVVAILWAMGSYLYQQFPCYGHLWLNSPTTHSGKTKMLEVLWTLCYKALEPQLEPTPAALFRFPSVFGGTLLLDEIDNLDPEKRSAVISVLNSYASNGVVTRAVPGKNKKFTLEKLPVYCPKVIAGINNLPGTLQDRCIKIFLHRKKKSESVERFLPGTYQRLEPLRNQLEAWAVRDEQRIIEAYGDRDQLGVPSVADDRLRDILEPLFAIASVLPKWISEKLAEGTLTIAEERSAEEAESNAVVLGLQVLREHMPREGESWPVRTDEALALFSEEIPSIETKAQAQALMRRLGFKSERQRVGKKVLRAYRVHRRRVQKLSERYGLEH